MFLDAFTQMGSELRMSEDSHTGYWNSSPCRSFAERHDRDLKVVRWYMMESPIPGSLLSKRTLGSALHCKSSIHGNVRTEPAELSVGKFAMTQQLSEEADFFGTRL